MDPPKICIIGAGFSGMNVAIQLQKQLGLTNFVIFDENQDVGGTWLVNKYPGCACDVASHLYSLSYEPNPNWTHAYSSQEEIWRYMQGIAKKYDLYQNIKFNHNVKKMSWDEKINKWRVVVHNKITNMESEVIFNLVISGLGGLRAPNTPEEFLSFKGTRVHSAEWDTSLKLENKTVAVVGSGASAVQIIPNIAKKVKKLIVYQRHPAWVLPRMQFEVPDWLKWTFSSIPGVRSLYRYSIFFSNELTHPTFTHGSIFQKIGLMLGNYYLGKELGHNPELMEKVRPNYELGCKRITPSNIYYSALDMQNVEVIREKITKVKDNSIVTEDGDEKNIDVLILATGFRVQDFFAPLEIRAKNGVDMLELWKKEGPAAYMGMSCFAAPNIFFILGPNSGLGHNSIIFTIECQVNYVVKVVKEMMDNQWTVVNVKEKVEKAYMEKLLEDMKPKVWATGNCGSWYSDPRGVVTALSPYSLITYWRQTRTLHPQDYHFS